MLFEEVIDKVMLYSISPELTCECDEFHICQQCIEEDKQKIKKMTRTENITLTVFNPETEQYEDIRARVEFTLYVGRVEPFEADEYDWNILWIEGSDWVDEQIVDKAIETDFDIRSIFY